MFLICRWAINVLHCKFNTHNLLKKKKPHKPFSFKENSPRERTRNRDHNFPKYFMIIGTVPALKYKSLRQSQYFFFSKITKFENT